MTEAHEYPVGESYPLLGLTVLSGEQLESLKIGDEPMTDYARNYIAHSFGLDSDRLQWLRREDSTAVIALIDTIISRFTDQTGLHEREIMRLGLFVGSDIGDESISEQVTVQFQVRMCVDDVRLERQDLQELVQRGMKRRGAMAMVRKTIAALHEEIELATTTKTLPVALEEITESDEEGEAPASLVV